VPRFALTVSKRRARCSARDAGSSVLRDCQIIYMNMNVGYADEALAAVDRKDLVSPYLRMMCT
jgi:hypothetical protein